MNHKGVAMLPVKRILCPTDFSEPSFTALKSANELAVHFSATLYLVHVVPSIPVAPPMVNMSYAVVTTDVDIEKYREDLIRSSEKALETVIEEKTGHNLVGLYPIILEGDVPQQIVRTAEKKEIDIIVMGTHGQTGWRHLVFGSVAEKVVRLSPVPVLTIPAPKKE
jgi:universal stress protein A